MSHCTEFDCAVVNDRFEDALAALQAIIAGHGEAFRASRPALQGLLASLTA